jgi:hypothetical protein
LSNSFSVIFSNTTNNRMTPPPTAPCEFPFTAQGDLRFRATTNVECDVNVTFVQTAYALAAVLWLAPLAISLRHIVLWRRGGRAFSLRQSVSQLHVLSIVISVLYIAASVLRAVDPTAQVVSQDLPITVVFCCGFALLLTNLMLSQYIFFKLLIVHRLDFDGSLVVGMIKVGAILAYLCFMTMCAMPLVTAADSTSASDQAALACFSSGFAGFAIMFCMLPYIMHKLKVNLERLEARVVDPLNPERASSFAARKTNDLARWINRLLYPSVLIIFAVLVCFMIIICLAQARTLLPSYLLPLTVNCSALLSALVSRVLGNFVNTHGGSETFLWSAARLSLRMHFSSALILFESILYGNAMDGSCLAACKPNSATHNANASTPSLNPDFHNPPFQYKGATRFEVRFTICDALPLGSTLQVVTTSCCKSRTHASSKAAHIPNAELISAHSTGHSGKLPIRRPLIVPNAPSCEM